jgi:serine/threonine protein kinase
MRSTEKNLCKTNSRPRAQTPYGISPLCRAKVADFGLARTAESAAAADALRKKGGGNTGLWACGTPLWMAPEVLRGGQATRVLPSSRFLLLPKSLNH